MTPLVKGEIVA